MKWLFKIMIALILGVGLWLMSAQTTLACCCIEDDYDTGACKQCVDCGNNNDPGGDINHSGAEACPGYPSNYSISCMPNTEPGSCVSTTFRGTCNQYAPSLWTGCDGGCQINCGCCPPGQTYQCDAPSGTYDVLDDGRVPSCTNYHSDLYTGSVPNPLFDYNMPRDANPYCYLIRTNKQGVDIYGCYTNVSRCAIRSCGCRPACSAPTAPTLQLPRNGDTVQPNVTLSWSPPSSWGTGTSCPTTKRYLVFVGTTNPPPVDSLLC